MDEGLTIKLPCGCVAKDAGLFCSLHGQQQIPGIGRIEMGGDIKAELEKAIAAAEATISAAQLVLTYVEQKNKIVRESLDGIAKALDLAHLDFAFEQQVKALIGLPPFKLPDGNTVESDGAGTKKGG